MPQQQNNNPHAQAAQTYGKSAQQTLHQRSLEGQVLLKSNQRIQYVINHWDETQHKDLSDTLQYNRKIWTLFYENACDAIENNGEPKELHHNIENLAKFIFKREMDILAAPKKDKLDILVSINQQIAAGLMSNAQSAPPNTNTSIDSQT